MSSENAKEKKPRTLAFFEVFQSIEGNFDARIDLSVENEKEYFICLELMSDSLNKLVANLGKKYHNSKIETRKEFSTFDNGASFTK